MRGEGWEWMMMSWGVWMKTWMDFMESTSDAIPKRNDPTVGRKEVVC